MLARDLFGLGDRGQIHLFIPLHQKPRIQIELLDLALGEGKSHFPA